MHRLRALGLALVTIAGCGSETTRAVPPTNAVEPQTAPEPELPPDDPATLAVAEECERDSDCTVYFGACEQWHAVRAGTEADYEERLQREMSISGIGCPLLDDRPAEPRPDVVCDRGRCERVDR